MRESLGLAIQRIIGSQKFIYAMIPTLADSVMSLCGIDITQPAVLAMNAFFALLIFVQFILDARWGSPSDGTGGFDLTGGFALWGAKAWLLVVSLVAALVVSGCSFSFAAYERTAKTRAVLSMEGDAGESFCIDSLSVPVILDMRNLGWGQYSCERGGLAPDVTDQ